jgi:hypothetical protein
VAERNDEDTTEYKNVQKFLEQVLSVPNEQLDERRVGWEQKKKRVG